MNTEVLNQIINVHTSIDNSVGSFSYDQHAMDLSTVSIKIPQIAIYPVYYNNQSFPPIFIGAILNHKNVVIFRDIFVNIIAF